MCFYLKHNEDGSSCGGKYVAIDGCNPRYTSRKKLAKEYSSKKEAENDKYNIEYVVAE